MKKKPAAVIIGKIRTTCLLWLVVSVLVVSVFEFFDLGIILGKWDRPKTRHQLETSNNIEDVRALGKKAFLIIDRDKELFVTTVRFSEDVIICLSLLCLVIIWQTYRIDTTENCGKK